MLNLPFCRSDQNMQNPSSDRSFIIFGAPALGPEESDEVADCIERGWIGTGPKVEKFETNFAAYKGIPKGNILATNSCTSALHLSLIASGVGAGDEVITTAMTFCATANSIIHTGATPVIVDVDPLTQNISVEAIEAKINERTRAIVPVHFAGRLCDMPAIMALANKHQLKVIEDSAHAIETESAAGKAGTFGDFGCFSFYATKNITTGEGGMVIARNSDDIARMKTLALHGMSHDAWHRYKDEGHKHYLVTEAGFKYNMMDIQAALGIHQLARVESNWKRRQAIWDYYSNELSGLPLQIPAQCPQGERHAYHLFTLCNKHPTLSRDQILNAMTERKIGCGVHYLCLAEHPYYQDRYGWSPEQVSNATHIGRNTFSIPLSARVSDDEVEYIAQSLKQVLLV